MVETVRDDVHWCGFYWKDIDWTKELHDLGDICDICSGDSMTGHSDRCPYLIKNQNGEHGAFFLRNQIKNAVQREMEDALINE